MAAVIARVVLDFYAEDSRTIGEAIEAACEAIERRTFDGRYDAQNDGTRTGAVAVRYAGVLGLPASVRYLDMVQ